MPALAGCWLGTKGSGLGHSSCNQVRDPLTWVCGWETLALSKSVTKLHLTSVIPDFQFRCNIAGKKKKGKKRKSIVLTSGICRAFCHFTIKEGLKQLPEQNILFRLNMQSQKEKTRKPQFVFCIV